MKARRRRGDPRFDPILFDLDGTLVDSSLDLAAAVNRTLAHLLLPPLPEPEIIAFVGDGARKLIERTLNRAGRADVEATLAYFKADYRERCLVKTRPYPGIPALLRGLAGVSVGVVTNKPYEFARLVLDGLGLLPAIGAIVGGDEAGQLKPAPAPVRLCLTKLGCVAGNGLMIGDHSNDIQAGRSAGLSTCGVLWGFDRGQKVRAAKPDFLCANMIDLRKLLFGP